MNRAFAIDRRQHLTIGQLAAHGKVRVETVRYYERCGLLPRVPRTASGYRRYGPEAVKRLRFIRSAKQLGFSLAEVRELLSLRVRPGASCTDVRSRAIAKVRTIDARVAELERIRGRS
jgi:DNA-binding transcriptional MerR regulator